MRRFWPGLIALAVTIGACSSTTSSENPSAGSSNTTPGGAGSVMALASDGATGVTVPDGYTAVVVTPASRGTFPVRGSDGRFHVAYDLQVTNASSLPATLNKLEVVRGDDPTQVVASFDSTQLVNPSEPAASNLRQLPNKPADTTTIDPQQSRALFIQFDAESADTLPKAVLHHLYLSAKPSPPSSAVADVDYLAAPFDIAAGTPRVIPAPVRGPNWVALNGCCEAGFPHRSSLATFNGKLGNSQRFAIDWKRANDQGEFLVGDKTRNESFVDYGTDVYAVADGTVVGVLDDVDANSPGVLPAQDPVLAQKLTVNNADGNHVVIDIGGGVYAMYAHFLKGSIQVKVGDRVQRGDKIARLGNTGNSNASHLHFQLQTGPSLADADSLPYEIEAFTYRGQVDPGAIEAADNYLSGSFFPAGLPAGQARRDELPLNLAIVDFPEG